MSESFLHYIWQFQYFEKTNLQTSEGEPLQIFNTGHHNTNAGPDFSTARIKIGDIEWVGNVEIHIQSSAWYEHQHQHDPAYENVILHVVWKNDKPIQRRDGTFVPTLELGHRIEESIIFRYNKLINNPEEIPCAKSIQSVSDITKYTMLDKALLQRLESRATQLTATLEYTNHDWEEACYQLLCRNFGLKVNADPFMQLAKALPYRVLLKHADKILQLEAFLFGQAGFLDESRDDNYYQLLQREYQLLSAKYQLTEQKLHVAQWKFLRLRPANFPTIRLAQLAMILHVQKNIFSKILEAESIRDLRRLFSAQQSTYWLEHFHFAKKAKGGVASLGEISIDNIIINTVVPLLAAYGKAKDETLYLDRAVEFLQQISPEDNAVTRKWYALGLEIKSGFDSQGILELHTQFCLKRRCIDCNIGATLIRPKPNEHHIALRQ